MDGPNICLDDGHAPGKRTLLGPSHLEWSLVLGGSFRKSHPNRGCCACAVRNRPRSLLFVSPGMACTLAKTHAYTEV